MLPYSYGGNLGVLNGGSMDMRFFHRLGASQLLRTICSTTGGDAIVSMYGRKIGTEPEQFRHSKYIIAWGANIHGNNVHLWPFVEEARRNGAKLVVIDPYRTRTARVADWHIPINPGTDVALAMGMMHIIVRDGLHDCGLHRALRRRLRRVAEAAAEVHAGAGIGVDGHSGKTTSSGWRTSMRPMRPAVIRVNYGIQRTQNGGAAVRAVCMLPVITGSWKEVGGGLQLSLSGGFQLNQTAMERTDLMLKSPLGTSRAQHQHGGVGQGAHGGERSSGEGAVRVQLQSGGGVS